MRRSKWTIAGALLALASAPGLAQAPQAQPARQYLDLTAGETVGFAGVTLRATEATQAIAVTSSEMVTIAVIAGVLQSGDEMAGAGQALVTPIDGSRTRRYGFDAARLAATLPPTWQGHAADQLAALAESQRRRAFWGLVEPVGVNATAPVSPEAEAFRSAYLGNPTVLALRREAAGDRQALARLTVARFAEAVAARDAVAIADLIDPVPFSTANPDPAVWRTARATVAARLAADDALAAALAAPSAATNAADSFDLGEAFRVALVMRDRAFFVAEVEPIQ